MMIGKYEIAARTVMFILATVVLAGLIMLYVHSCDVKHSKAAQSRVDSAQGDAAHNSAADAINTVTGVGANQAASEDLTRRNEKEIRNAAGANDPVNPAVRDAGIASLCRRTASRNDPRCRVQQPAAH